MDIGSMSMAMSQNSLKTAVSLSLMKIQMNTSKEMANGMNDMMKNMAVDPVRGQKIDVKA